MDTSTLGGLLVVIGFWVAMAGIVVLVTPFIAAIVRGFVADVRRRDWFNVITTVAMVLIMGGIMLVLVGALAFRGAQ